MPSPGRARVVVRGTLRRWCCPYSQCDWHGQGLRCVPCGARGRKRGLWETENWDVLS